jgi:transcriptional regulator with XRE-family HTH domain
LTLLGKDISNNVSSIDILETEDYNDGCEPATAMIDEKRLYQALGDRLRALRTSVNGPKLTQAKLADDIGLERTSITNIERGNQKIPLHVLYRICESLHVPITDLLPELASVQDTSATGQADLEEFDFNGRTQKLTPLVRQKLAELLNLGEQSDQTGNRAD